MPKMGWILGFSAMASLGLPGLAGFWGEFPALLAAWNPNEVLSGQLDLFRVLTVIAALGTVLAAGYLLWLYQRTAFGSPNPEFVDHGHGNHGAPALSAASNELDDGDHDAQQFDIMAVRQAGVDRSLVPTPRQSTRVIDESMDRVDGRRRELPEMVVRALY